MSSEGEKLGVDLRSFTNEVTNEFRKLNARIDDLASPIRPKSSRGSIVEEREDEDSDDGVVNS